MVYNSILNDPSATPQSQKAREDQVKNNAGGYGFQLDKWKRLDQFLVLGSSDGTFYVAARDLTMANLDNLKACLSEDGKRTVDTIVKISVDNRAIKNETCIFALAVSVVFGDAETRKRAKDSVSQVCRTGTHILHFASYLPKLRKGWSPSRYKAVRRWYEDQAARDVHGLAYQMVKYQQRDGWSHRDVIRLTHPDPNNTLTAALYNWAVRGYNAEKKYPEIVESFEAGKTADVDKLLDLIAQKYLSREMVPSQMLNEPRIARALAMQAPMGALIRNLGNYSKLDLLTPGDVLLNRVITMLGDRDALRKARIHPIEILIALKTYASGQGFRGSNTWTVVPQVVDALDKAFYLSFEHVEPLNKRLLIAVDSSGSMKAPIATTPVLTATMASSAMALLAASIEPLYQLVSFDTQVRPVFISPRTRLDDAMEKMQSNGGTDVAAPINDATHNNRVYDAIIIYTDGETWSGHNHPYQAMAEYRRRVNANTKLVIAVTAANALTVAVPEDALSLTVCGFDAAVPTAIREFLRD